MKKKDKASTFKRKLGGFSARKVAVVAIFTAASLIMFMIENLFPPLFIPGAKAGLSNIPSFYLLYALDFKCALSVLVMRVLLGSALTGSFSSLMYSLPAGIVALLSAALIKRFIRATPLCTSVACAVIHNIVQNAVFIVLSQTAQMAVYFPYLAIIGSLAGCIVGIAVTLMLNSRTLSKAVSGYCDLNREKDEK